MLLILLKLVASKFRKAVACIIAKMGKIGLFTQKFLTFRGNSNRYGIFAVLVGLFLLIYLLPSVMRWNFWFRSDSTSACIDSELYEYHDNILSNNVVFVHNPRHETDMTSPLSVSGNGFLLVSMKTGQLYIKHHRTLSVPTGAYILYEADIIDSAITKSEDALLVNIADGYVKTLKCHLGFDHPVAIFDKVFVHRSIPNLVMQEITVKNPSSHTLKVRLSKHSASQRYSQPQQKYSTIPGLNENSRHFFTRKVTLDVPEKKNTTFLHVLQSGTPQSEEMTVQPHKTESFVIYTLANYTLFENTPLITNFEAENNLSLSNQKSLLELLTSVMKQDSNSLFWKHAELNRNMYRTGFGISHSKAPNALNGDRINLTLSYVSAHYSSMALLDSQSKETAEKSVFYADKCYDDHHTLQHPRLWDMPTTLEEHFDFVRTWAITLEKHGCRDLVAAGAEGVITSMVLSFGGLHFTSHHLEFTIHPSELHRDLMHFRRLPYGSRVSVNISVEMGDDNRAQLFVSVDGAETVYYACDAGCLDAPVQLTKTSTRIPVKLTNPVMPILYVTSDKEHIEELKDALHFTDIKEAPAHEDDVIALHKHGHQFGGLPTVFWVTIILLIVIFHMFLVKLIVSEYYKGDSKYSPPPAPYNRMQSRFAA